MKYKKLFFRNPQDEKDPGKYYPYPVYEGTIGTDDFVTDISHSTSLTGTDVKAVVSEILVVFRRYLSRGHKVRIDGLGTFKVSFKGDGELKAEDVSVSNIDRSSIRITFVSDSGLKQEMQSGISFSKAPEKTDEKKTENSEEQKAEEKPAEDLGTQQD